MAAGHLVLSAALAAAPGYGAPPAQGGAANDGTPQSPPANTGAGGSSTQSPDGTSAQSPGDAPAIPPGPPNRSTVIPATAPTHPPDPPRPSPYPTSPTGVPDPTRPPPPRLTAPPPVLYGPPAPVEPAPAFTPVPLDLRPPPPYGNGTGLIVGAGVAAAATLGLAAGRFGLNLGEPTVRNETTAFYLAAVATPITVAAGIGLAAGAGHLRGRWDGYRSAYDGEPKVRASAFTQSGAVLLGMGAVGYLMAWIPWHGDSSLEGRGGGTLLAESVSSLILMTGAGLVAYGVSWRRHATKYGYYQRLGLRPAASPTFAGLSISGRF